MKTIAKAAMGALALASLAAGATTSANAQIEVQVGPPAVVAHDPCLRAPEFRPAFCFRHHPEGMAWGYWRHRAYEYRPYAYDWDRIHREHERERQAFLEHRYYDYDRR